MAETDAWERFVSFVDQSTPDECWVWTGARDHDGYGAFKLDGRVVKAHRLSFAGYYCSARHRPARRR